MLLKSSNLNKEIEISEEQLSQVLEIACQYDMMEELDCDYSSTGEYDIWLTIFGNTRIITDKKGRFNGLEIGFGANKEILFDWPEEFDDIFDLDINLLYDILEDEEYSIKISMTYEYELGWYDPGDYYNPPEGESTQLTDWEVCNVYLVHNDEDDDITDSIDDEILESLGDDAIHRNEERILDCINRR